MWSVGCIFAEMLTGKPLFPGKNVVYQLDFFCESTNGVDQFKQDFARLEDHKEDEEERNSPPVHRKYTSLPKEWVCSSEEEGADSVHAQPSSSSVVFIPPHTPNKETGLSSPSSQKITQVGKAAAKRFACLMRSDSICASRCIGRLLCSLLVNKQTKK